MKLNIPTDYIKNLLLTDLETAKKEFKKYWISWNTVGGHHFEGVIIETEDDDYHVMCTDGIKRVI